MTTKPRRHKITLKLDALKVETLVMAASAPIRAVTTSQTCPTRCETLEECSNEYCANTVQADCSGACGQTPACYSQWCW